MFTVQQIEQFYRKLGINSEAERKRLQTLKDLGAVAGAETSVRLSASPTETGHQDQHGELVRTTERDQ